MSRKVINITHSANKYDILSQTPKNYDKDNYFLKELQEKVTAEWKYRPNRVDVEFETEWGQQKYEPMEVVVQSVKSEKGTDISNDTRNLVFSNILEDRFDIGNRFRFSEDYNLSRKEDEKNVWLVTNLNKVNMTSSVVVERCNGSIGSVVNNGDGTVSYHYEPVIQGKDLTAVNFFYNETLISPQSQLLVIAQHNEFTKQYKINQRFIIGYDKVYRIKAINKFYSQSTFNPQNVGLVRIYMEITESSPYDDFEHRIAYQGNIDNNVPVIEPKGYSIQLKQPENIPLTLPMTDLIFEPVLYNGEEIVEGAKFNVSYELRNDPVTRSGNNQYFYYHDNGDGTYTFKRIKTYTGGNLFIKFASCDVDDLFIEISMKMVR